MTSGRKVQCPTCRSKQKLHDALKLQTDFPAQLVKTTSSTNVIAGQSSSTTDTTANVPGPSSSIDMVNESGLNESNADVNSFINQHDDGLGGEPTGHDEAAPDEAFDSNHTIIFLS